MILNSLFTTKNITSKCAGKFGKVLMIKSLCLIIMAGSSSVSKANLSIYGSYTPVYEKNFSIIPYLNHQYILTLTDAQGEFVMSLYFEDELPVITKLNDVLYKICHSTEPQVRYNIYFEASLGQVTRSYLNSIYIGENIIAYFESSEKGNNLIIEEMFSDYGIYMEIVRDFSPATIKIDVILDALLVNDDTIRIVYLQGEEYEEITEEIAIQ